MPDDGTATLKHFVLCVRVRVLSVCLSVCVPTCLHIYLDIDVKCLKEIVNI